MIRAEDLKERDSAEVLSVLGSEGAARNHRDERKHGTNAEFLSGFHKEDKLTPVITITVYLGTEKWDGPRKLSDMFREKDAWLKSLISDYKIHLVVPREMDDFSLFQTSLGAVLEVIKASEDKEAMRTLFATNPRYKAMDNESVLAINTFIGGNFPIAQEGGITNMCKALEDMRKGDVYFRMIGYY